MTSRILSLALAVLVACGGLGAASLLSGCTQTPPTVVLHSMRASGNTAFVCWGSDNKAYRLEDCPDFIGGTRHLYGLVTQTETDEVAVVDTFGGVLADGTVAAPGVLDEDPSSPGYSFLRVGARPGAIVSTPGGSASFVAVSGFHKNGIFALPTACVGAPVPGAVGRDLTSWSACALSSAPGDMTMLFAPQGACASTVAVATNVNCTADLAAEVGPAGQRLLAVALPEEQRIALIDAQTVLNGRAGAFALCPEVGSIGLASAVSAGQPFLLPPDLAQAPGCTAPAPADAPPSAPSFAGGFALDAANGRLFVADRQLPIVHVLDVSDPCGGRGELAPLRATSFEDPTRTVTASRLAVSPLTPSGKQFLYAVDDRDLPTSSVMVFDVSPGAAGNQPLLLPSSARQPFVPPDRIRFGAAVQDVAFALRDFPSSDPITGVGSFGTLCDPNPNHAAGEPGTSREPNPPDYTDGARPGDLRGLFGFALMTNGQIGVIDVEDFDAPCRRSGGQPNTSSSEDFHGCASDDHAAFCTSGTDCFVRNNTQPTVSYESSCRMVEPHRPRSAFVSVTSQTNGVHAPSLRAFPQFSDPNPSNRRDETERPHMLGVNFPNPAAGTGATLANTLPLSAQVNVGITPYSTAPASGQSQLDINPSTSRQNSLVLPLNEPRSYAFDDNFALIYEGKLLDGHRTGFLRPVVPGAADQWEIYDADGNFCRAGVEDASQIGAELPSAAALPGWTDDHADHVQLTGPIPALDPDGNDYWHHNNLSCTYDSCLTEFGSTDDPTALNASRDLPILETYSSRLRVSCGGAADCQKLHCCFPAGMTYAVRASKQWLLVSASSGALHDMGVDPGSDRCVHQAACDARRKHQRSRVFEICDTNPVPSTDENPAQQQQRYCGCQHDFNVGPVEPSQPGVPAALSAGSECIFENLSSRFAVYRGRSLTDSQRDMAFTWQVTGGFAPLSMSLAVLSANVDPRSFFFMPHQDVLAVTDGAALGLTMISLDTLGALSPSPFF